MAIHRTFLVATCLALLSLYAADGRQLLAAAPAPAPSAINLGQNFYAAPSGAQCTNFCPSLGLKTVAFSQPGQQGSGSAACAALVNDVWVSGYQAQGASPAVCNVASAASLLASPDFACLCLPTGTIQGLVRADTTADCTASCETGFNGYTGVPAQPDTNYMSFTCLPYSDLGQSNHLGSVSEGSATPSCITAEATAVSNEAQFSCLCLFKQPAVTSSSVLSPATRIPSSVSG